MIILSYVRHQRVTNTMWGRLVLCVALVLLPQSFSLLPGRRKRPLPAQPNPRPYGYEAASEAMSHNGSQLAKQGTQIDGYGGASEAMSHNIYL